MIINMLKRTLKNKIIKSCEKKYLKKLRKRNQNLTPTIVCNNCIAGVIYHNLGLQFQSPTINLFIKGEEYLEFVKNFEYYSKCDVVEVHDEDQPYPVGKIVPNDDEHKEIKIFFQHYKSFDDAKKKWLERYKRVNWNNVYFLWEFYDTVYDNALMDEFDQLEGINHLLILHKNFSHIKNAVYVSCYTDDKPKAKILQYDGITGKRYLEEFDYVSYLNK